MVYLSTFTVKKQPEVGKYAIHGSYGLVLRHSNLFNTPATSGYLYISLRYHYHKNQPFMYSSKNPGMCEERRLTWNQQITHSQMLNVWHIYLHLVYSYGKCRWIYHTLSVWDLEWNMIWTKHLHFRFMFQPLICSGFKPPLPPHWFPSEGKMEILERDFRVHIKVHEQKARTPNPCFAGGCFGRRNPQSCFRWMVVVSHIMNWNFHPDPYLGKWCIWIFDDLIVSNGLKITIQLVLVLIIFPWSNVWYLNFYPFSSERSLVLGYWSEFHAAGHRFLSRRCLEDHPMT